MGVPHVPSDLLEYLTLGRERITDQDPEYAIRQLSEVAARALSPGTNDPVTTMDILDRFGDALCALQDRWWPSGVHADESDKVRLVRPTVDFDGVAHTMFEMVRQYGSSSPEVTLHLLKVLQITATCLRSEESLQAAYHDAHKALTNPRDLHRLERAYHGALRAMETGLPK